VRAKAKPTKSMSEDAARRDEGSPQPAPDAPSFDRAALDDLKAVMDPAKFVALAEKLTQGLEQRLDRLAELIDAANWVDAAQGAHDIVSVAGNIGAMRLSALARFLEHACKTGSESERQAAAKDLRNEAAGALSALKRHQGMV
jgi:HPt (histidine-containing phosphotransfer) domain-containing protein